MRLGGPGKFDGFGERDGWCIAEVFFGGVSAGVFSAQAGGRGVSQRLWVSVPGDVRCYLYEWDCCVLEMGNFELFFYLFFYRLVIWRWCGGRTETWFCWGRGRSLGLILGTVTTVGMCRIKIQF